VLVVRALALGEPCALRLAPAHQRVDVQDAHVPDLLDRFLDLGLVRIPGHQERVRVVLQAGVGLLRDDRADDHVAWALHASSPPSSASSTSGSVPSGCSWSASWVASLASETAGSNRSVCSPVSASSASAVNRTRSAYRRSKVDRLPG